MKTNEVKLVPFFAKVGPDGHHEPAAVRFYTRSGQIHFNKQAMLLLGLEKGNQPLCFFTDENDPKAWYVKAGVASDLRLKSTKNSGLCAFSVSASRAIAKSIGLKKVRAFSVKVAPKPIEGGYYALLTVAPYKIIEYANEN